MKYILACRQPDDLYKGGLQRELFLPFIDRLKKETEVHDMASPVDYRRLAHHRKGLYFSPRDSKDPDEELTAHFASLADTAGGQPPEPRQISVQMGRKLNIPLAGRGLDSAVYSAAQCMNCKFCCMSGQYQTLDKSDVPAIISLLKMHLGAITEMIERHHEFSRGDAYYLH